MQWKLWKEFKILKYEFGTFSFKKIWLFELWRKLKQCQLFLSLKNMSSSWGQTFQLFDLEVSIVSQLLSKRIFFRHRSCKNLLIFSILSHTDLCETDIQIILSVPERVIFSKKVSIYTYSLTHKKVPNYVHKKISLDTKALMWLIFRQFSAVF